MAQLIQFNLTLNNEAKWLRFDRVMTPLETEVRPEIQSRTH